MWCDVAMGRNDVNKFAQTNLAQCPFSVLRGIAYPLMFVMCNAKVFLSRECHVDITWCFIYILGRVKMISLYGVFSFCFYLKHFEKGILIRFIDLLW